MDIKFIKIDANLLLHPLTDYFILSFVAAAQFKDY